MRQIRGFMKISLNWLKTYINTDLSAAEIDTFLTASGLEVEGIEEFESVKGGLKGLIIGEVMTCVKHPNADKLSLTTVDIGFEPFLQIVCGAPNVTAGIKVIVAPVGTMVHPNSGEAFEIKKSKIRGELSEGMICAEDEIGLGQSHDGLLILPADAKIGMFVKDYFNIENDEILEIGLTPNRADAASHFGVARDLAAVVNTTNVINKKTKVVAATLPDISAFKEGNDTSFSVEVEDKTACPRYSGLLIKKIKVSESPAWLKNRLRSIGVGPINNIVDITNFVLHELGQPLHAFDADQIKGKKVIVRSAKTGEKFTTLDKIDRTLNATDLLICDESSPMCIAGVFGGVNSGIKNSTTTVFLESAYFNPASIRKTSKSHGLKTDASFRYERGTDPEITLIAMKRAALLISVIAGGEVASKVIDVYDSKIHPAVFEITYRYIDSLSGEVIDRNIIKVILENLGIKILASTAEGMKLEIPTYKVDVTRPVDVVEEILRVYGYDRIPVPAKLNASVPFVRADNQEKLLNKVSNYLSSNGFNEILSNSLTKTDYLSMPGWNVDEAVKILNPLSTELSVLRQTLMMSGLEAIQYNCNRRQQDLRFYEFGKVYHMRDGQYVENYRLAIFLTGNKQEVNWKNGVALVDFYLLKTFVQQIISLSGMKENKIRLNEVPAAGCDYGISFQYGNHPLVELGSISTDTLKKFDINQEVLFAEFQWQNVLKNSAKEPIRYQEVSKFPAVKRDLSMMLPKQVLFRTLEELAYKTETKLLKDVRLFDIYEGEKIESGKKSLAISFILQDETQTLNEKQIDKTMERLMTAFEKDVGAVIRKG